MLAMFHSGETRWFIEGSLPAEVRDWFQSETLGTWDTERTDAYLLLPNCRTAGVKLREGRLEIKASTRQAEPVSYANGVSGYRDAWVKWSCEASDIDALTSMLGTGGDTWAFVRKRRCLRKLSLDGTSPVYVSADVRLERGCQVEITSLLALTAPLGEPPSDDDWAAASPWWSLSFEAFGPATPEVTDEVLSLLDAAATEIFRDPPPCELSREASMAYPTWLLSLPA